MLLRKLKPFADKINYHDILELNRAIKVKRVETIG